MRKGGVTTFFESTENSQPLSPRTCMFWKISSDYPEIGTNGKSGLHIPSLPDRVTICCCQIVCSKVLSDHSTAEEKLRQSQTFHTSIASPRDSPNQVIFYPTHSLHVRCVWNESAISNHVWLIFTYIYDARMADYIHTHPYNNDGGGHAAAACF